MKLILEVNQEHKRFFIRNKVYPVIEGNAEIIFETDEKWLYFILTQLIQNAIKYSTNKATEVKISFSKTAVGQMIEVGDFGVGIPKEVANYLGHSVEVESVVDEGSLFRIIFK